MNKDLIPSKLHHLIPLVEKWGIENDERRINVIYNTLNKELIELVQNVDNKDINELNRWLNDSQVTIHIAEHLKFRAFIKAYEYAYSLLKIDKDKVPEKLHHLIPLVQKWGIGDDGYRDEALTNANITELIELTTSISDEDANNLNEWLIDPNEMKLCTQEYLMYSAFFLAFEYANAILNDRLQKNENL
jgi:hypothetical protein